MSGKTLGRLRNSPSAAMGNHVVGVQRRSGSSFSDIVYRGLVSPNEPIRYTVSQSDLFYGRIAERTFTVRNASGEIVAQKNILTNIAGNGWWDTVAPVEPGTYSVEVVAPDFPFGSHPASFEFTVSTSAPPPPSPPPDSGSFGDIKTLGLIGVGLLGLWVAKDVIS